MTARFSVSMRTRLLATILPAILVLGLLSGCDLEQQVPYPADLPYPLRADPLVTDTLASVPTNWDRPGAFPHDIFELAQGSDKSRILLPSQLKGDQERALATVLANVFGTPAEPKVAEIDQETRQALQVEDKTLSEGSILYRRHCLHCHGLTGNGRGPTAGWVNPHPRDYRQGIFKFTSSSQDAGERKPRRQDLLRTLREGLEGTTMPTFGLLSDQELNALASYVIHLSLRGQSEFMTMQELIKPTSEELAPNEIKSFVAEKALPRIASWWKEAQEEKNLIKPGGRPNLTGQALADSIKRGKDLFTKKGEAGCIDCHIAYGRRSIIKYDSWGTMVRALDFTSGTYRGGRRPLDLYWRIHSGINGSGMTAFSKSLNNDQIWDLVNFIQTLPYPAMRQEYDINVD